MKFPPLKKAVTMNPVEALYQEYLRNPVISTDTRSIPPGALFFALKGPNFNANTFAAEAISKGARMAIIDEKEFEGENTFLVDDVLTFLQQLASYHRKKLGLPVIAITGSNGKTTTKELCHRVLQAGKNVYATKGNFNNHIGVPLTLLNLTSEHQMAIVELGANHPGEIALLCEIVQPDFGLITNNGKDHLEGFGSVEGVIEANGELFDFFRKNKKGHVFVNADDPVLMERSADLDRITYGSASKAYCKGQVKNMDPFVEFSFEVMGRSWTVKTKLVGQYNLPNLLAASCMGMYFSIPPAGIVEAIAGYEPQNNRSQLLKKGSYDIIMDAYNANPSSMEAAIDNFSSLQHGPKVAILGDMLEMGSESSREHELMIEKLERTNFDLILLVGNEFGKTKSSPKMQKFSSWEELGPKLKGLLPQACWILLKGSRGIRLEKLMDYL